MHYATKQNSILKDAASFWNHDRKITQRECLPFSLLSNGFWIVGMEGKALQSDTVTLLKSQSDQNSKLSAVQRCKKPRDTLYREGLQKALQLTEKKK